MRKRFLALMLFAVALPGAPAVAQPVDEAGGLGKVSFETSCKPETHADFNRGVGFLHSFWYDAALSRFERVRRQDPDCAMAYWGIAMTFFPQLNGWPGPDAESAAQRALEAADQASERTPREAAYIHALHLFYDGFRRDDALEYAQRYAEAMAEVASNYPDDLEAQVFYALALLASDPGDGDVALTNPSKAYAILAPLFAAHPDHPGIAHYIIHACDNPQMAQLALPAARRYAQIAPAAPHALHMPGHIFARLGFWQDDISSNLASELAAEHLAGTHDGALPAGGMSMGAENRLHAMEFLEYAYLQIGEDEKARAIIAGAATVKAADVDPRYPDYFGEVQARYPALYAIETRDWDMAGQLTPVAQGNARSGALTVLAHVIAAAHRHDRRAARAALDALDALARTPQAADRLGTTLPAEIRSWAAFTQGDLVRAVAQLRTVAARQDKVGKGEVEVPAREMLADMLLLRGRAAEALHEYQLSMVTDPNRFNALRGAAEAAQRAGNRALAADYYRTLLGNCPHPSGPARAVLEQAAAAVAGGS